MTRYFTAPKRPRAFQDDGEWAYQDPVTAGATTVYEPEEENVFSGLLNPEGEPLYRRARQPIGFLHREET